jgi:hypothetical protein
MKFYFYFFILIANVACKKIDNYPNSKTDIGSIAVNTNGKIWNNLSNEATQITYISDNSSFIAQHPCYKGHLSLKIATFTKLDGYRRTNLSFTLPAATGTYMLKNERGTDVCTNLKAVQGLYFSSDDGDVGIATYQFLEDIKHQLTISELSTNKLSGNFDLTYVHTSGVKSIEYPDTLRIQCASFIAVEGYQ